ncbi:MAG TPA: hypothetical protein PLG07_06685 [Phenylobacterium sp.]|nr:hypothetical protein [Phenylobacterium sp.]
MTADNESFAGWVGKMKVKFREKPAPVGASTRQAATPAAGKTAEAAPPKGKAKG